MSMAATAFAVIASLLASLGVASAQKLPSGYTKVVRSAVAAHNRVVPGHVVLHKARKLVKDGVEIPYSLKHGSPIYFYGRTGQATAKVKKGVLTGVTVHPSHVLVLAN